MTYSILIRLTALPTATITFIILPYSDFFFLIIMFMTAAGNLASYELAIMIQYIVKCSYGFFFTLIGSFC